MSHRGSPEIETTPEMIEAGYRAFINSGVTDDPLEADKLLVEEIYRAMRRISLESSYIFHGDMRPRTEPMVDMNPTDCLNTPPAGEAIGFVTRELSRIGIRLRKPDISRSEYERLYAAQQALSWALDPTTFASPYELMAHDTQKGSADCSVVTELHTAH